MPSYLAGAGTKGPLPDGPVVQVGYIWGRVLPGALAMGGWASPNTKRGLAAGGNAHPGRGTKPPPTSPVLNW